MSKQSDPPWGSEVPEGPKICASCSHFIASVVSNELFNSKYGTGGGVCATIGKIVRNVDDEPKKEGDIDWFEVPSGFSCVMWRKCSHARKKENMQEVRQLTAFVE